MVTLCLGLAAEAQGFSGTISVGVDSEYLVRPGFVVHNHPISWTNVRLEHDGWYVGAWGSIGLDGQIEDFGEEVDITLGKKFSLAGFRFDLSGSYFVLSEFGEWANDLYVFDARVEAPDKVPFVTPWAAVRYFGSVGEKSPAAGWFGWVGVQRAQPLGFQLPFQEGEAVLNLDAWAAFSAGGAFRGDAGPVYTRLRASTVIVIDEATTFSPYIAWQAPIQDAGRYVDGDHHVVYGFSVTRSF